MVVALGPGKFYGSGLPRPHIYRDVKLNEERIDPPVPVLDPLMSWANQVHWSMGGLSYKRHRLQGRIEGSIKKLKAEQEKMIKQHKKETMTAKERRRLLSIEIEDFDASTPTKKFNKDLTNIELEENGKSEESSDDFEQQRGRRVLSTREKKKKKKRETGGVGKIHQSSPSSTIFTRARSKADTDASVISDGEVKTPPSKKGRKLQGRNNVKTT